MNSTIYDQIKHILKMNEEMQSSYLRYFARLHIEYKIEIFKHQKNIFHKLRQLNNGVEHTILSYCALLLSIEEYFKKIKELNHKNIENLSPDEFQKLSQTKAKIFKNMQFQKHSKHDKLLGYWSVVKTLKDEDFSYRQIAKYLKKHHRIEVAHSTIWILWQELETNNKN